MRALVTGATGFIGRHAVRALLRRGVEVHTVASGTPSDLPGGAVYHRVDLLTDTRELSSLMQSVRPTHLLHLAWYAVPGKYWRSLENYRWVGATMDLVRAFREHGGARVTAAGTCAEYDTRNGFCQEGITPVAPESPYGIAKDATRRLLESYARETGLSLAWGRLFFLYGPGEQPQRLVPSVICSLLDGKEALCTEGTQVRDFLHVSDVAEALVALLLSEVTGAVNIASSSPVTVRDLVSRAASQLGATDRVRLGAIPTREEPSHIVGDDRRLRSEVKWLPQFDLDSGLADTIAWWRSVSS